GRPDVALAHYNVDSLPIDTVSVLLNTPPTIAGDTYTVDKTAPTETSFVADDPLVTNANTVHYTVTFSEAVSGVDASQFSLVTSGISGASIESITEVAGSGGTQYSVAVATGSGDGTVQLNFVGAGV